MTIMLVVPSIHASGMDAARYGMAMSSIATPHGFTFCPYPHGSVERWNFLSGAVQWYTHGDPPNRGEQ